MPVTTTQQSPTQSPQLFPGELVMPLLQIAPVFIALFALNIWQKRRARGPKLGFSRYATPAEFAESQKVAIKQIRREHLSGKHTEIGGWIHPPKPVFLLKGRCVIGDARQSIVQGRLNEHFGVFGESGSGKDFSIFNPLERSMIAQGYAAMVLDCKGDEERSDKCSPSSALAGLNLRLGGESFAIAPGFRDSAVLNILDFVTDATSALQVSSVAHANMHGDGGEKDSGFFSNAGKILMQGLFLYAKYIAQQLGIIADVALCHKLLSLPDFVTRIQSADIPQHIKVIFGQFIAAAGSEETAASIAATALGIFTRFQISPAWATFCGKSTVPLILGPQQLVTFRMNPLYELSLAPLMAIAIYMMAIKNVYSRRPYNVPLFISLNEFPRFNFPNLAGLMMVARSKLVVFGLAAQNLPDIVKTYGREAAQSIVGGCKTEFVGMLSKETAQHYSDTYGREDIRYQTIGSSGPSGISPGRGSSSSSENEALTTRELIPMSEFLTLPRGTFIMRSPSTAGKDHKGRRVERLPVRLDIKISKAELRDIERSKKAWLVHRAKLVKRPLALSYTNDQLEALEQIAERMLPMPVDTVSQHLPQMY